jgi:hypothetical protein
MIIFINLNYFTLHYLQLFMFFLIVIFRYFTLSYFQLL